MRVYFVKEKCADTGIAVIADTAKEAKKIAWNDAREYLEDAEFIDLSVTWIKKANIVGLNKGCLDDFLEGVKRGLYNFTIDETCPKCGATYVSVYYDNGFYCSKCEDEPFPPQAEKKIKGE